jgi:SAM-dependent methyltransferase
MPVVLSLDIKTMGNKMYPKAFKIIALKMPIIKNIVVERDLLRSKLGHALNERDRINEILNITQTENDQRANALVLFKSERERLDKELAIVASDCERMSNKWACAETEKQRLTNELNFAISTWNQIANEQTSTLAVLDKLSKELNTSLLEQDSLTNNLSSAWSERDSLTNKLSSALSERDSLANELMSAQSERDRIANELALFSPYLEIIRDLVKKVESNYRKSPLIAVEESSVWQDSAYYSDAEDWTWLFWDRSYPFLPLFEQLDISVVLELACGHGRHTEALLNKYPDAVTEIHVMDILGANVEYCKKRFGSNGIVRFHKNNGISFDGIENESLTAIFCYDAMVHFRRDVVESYISSASNVLRKGGRALFHHSNYTNDPDSAFGANPHARAYMSQQLIRKYSNNAGLIILEQQVINWGSVEQLDCVTLIEKP